jgi:hypothetical protein
MADLRRGSRFGRGGRRRIHAQPMATVRRAGPGPRARVWLGWIAAAALVALIAFVAGRAGSEAGVASPSPSPSSGPLTVTFGTALDPVSGESIGDTSRFRAGDSVAYSVRLAAAPGVTHILVEIIRLVGSTETVAQPPSTQGIVATSRVFAFKVRATDLLTAWGPGSYAMRIYWEGETTPFAVGRFTLIETPAAS